MKTVASLMVIGPFQSSRRRRYSKAPGRRTAPSRRDARRRAERAAVRGPRGTPSLEMILNAREVVLLGSGVGCVAVKSAAACRAIWRRARIDVFGGAGRGTHERRAAAAHRASDVAAFEDGRGRSHKKRSRPNRGLRAIACSERDRRDQSDGASGEYDPSETYGGGTAARTRDRLDLATPALTYDAQACSSARKAERPGGGRMPGENIASMA